MLSSLWKAVDAQHKRLSLGLPRADRVQGDAVDFDELVLEAGQNIRQLDIGAVLDLEEPGRAAQKKELTWIRRQKALQSQGAGWAGWWWLICRCKAIFFYFL